jgi:hypothetical protein
MRSRRPLVLVVHNDPDVRVAQANDLTRAGYRCLVAGDPAAGLWFALKFALEMVPSLYSAVVLVSPAPPAEHELPEMVACVPVARLGEPLVDAVGCASRAIDARLTGRTTVSRAWLRAVAPAGTDVESKTGALACS